MTLNGQKREKDTTKRFSGSKFVVLFHGPDVFDKGYARKLVNLFPDAIFYQAGTMGRTAAYDNYMEEVIAVEEPPGRVIKNRIFCDYLVIVIHPKSEFSGLSFVSIILENAKPRMPVAHIDCLSKKFVVWQGKFPHAVKDKLCSLGFKKGEKIIYSPSIAVEGKRITRHLRACSRGDFVLCNNIVIGTAIDEDVSITTNDNRIVETRGIDVKKHGIEKIGEINIRTAKCCSTPHLRSDNVTPRIVKKEGNGVAFVNHAGADVYCLTDGCEGAVAVGDDTARIVGDILYRFNMPVFAITDGDWDKVFSCERFCPGSVLVEVEKDDETGILIFDKVFRGKDRIKKSFNEVKDEIECILKRKILKLRMF
ncbi:MAG: DUF2117 domain-containing protein [Candidatus Methanofastidiosia archaeon]